MTMQAIETTYKGLTNHRDARIIVKAQAGRRTFGWNHNLNSEQNHAAAARAYAEALKWTGEWVGGAKADDTGYVFVNTRWAAGQFTVGGAS